MSTTAKLLERVEHKLGPQSGTNKTYARTPCTRAAAGWRTRHVDMPRDMNFKRHAAAGAGAGAAAAAAAAAAGCFLTQGIRDPGS